MIQGLASGLSGLSDADDEYVFLALEGADEWLRPFVRGPARIHAVPMPRSTRQRLARAMPAVAAMWRRRPWRTVAGPPTSDGTVERLGADVVHFAHQWGFQTRIPSIYHPHDLQHLHLPQFFSPEQRAARERWYRTLCAQASMVAVASTWTKRDVEAQYRLPADRVVVVPWAPPTSAYRAPDSEAEEAARRRLGVPADYVLYPAQTWPHKNHVNLVRALAALRERDGLRVPLVASGHRNEHFPAIAAEVTRLGLDDQVHWTGFVSTEELVALYAGARAVVIPTRFEAASAPLWEAFLAGVPAACSNVTSLPEQAGDAALIFDPDDIAGMAEAIRRLWTDAELRTFLVRRGRERIASLSWDRTARHFRAHYRRLAGHALSDEDRAMIDTRAAL